MKLICIATDLILSSTFLYLIFRVILKVDYVIILIIPHIPFFFILAKCIHVYFQQAKHDFTPLSVWLAIFYFQFLVFQVLSNSSLCFNLPTFISLANHSFLFSTILLSFVSTPMIQINPSNTFDCPFCNSVPFNYLYHSKTWVCKVTLNYSTSRQSNEAS